MDHNGGIAILKRFSGKVTIVTGAGSGIGRAVALLFAKEGANVVINDIKPTDEVLKEIKSFNGKSVQVKADVTKSDDVMNIVKVALEQFGKIDVLVNNVGLFRAKLFVEMDEEHWNRTMDVNLKSTFLCCKEVVPHMIKRKYGKIVNVSSIRGKTSATYYADYVAAKHAVLGLTRALAVELIPYNINVNAVCPGCVDTPMARSFLTEQASILGITPEENIKARISPIPQRRMAKPEEIAATIAFLASDESEYIVGQAVNVCGGVLIGV